MQYRKTTAADYYAPTYVVIINYYLSDWFSIIEMYHENNKQIDLF